MLACLSQSLDTIRGSDDLKSAGLQIIPADQHDLGFIIDHKYLSRHLIHYGAFRSNVQEEKAGTQSPRPLPPFSEVGKRLIRGADEQCFHPVHTPNPYLKNQDR